MAASLDIEQAVRHAGYEIVGPPIQGGMSTVYPARQLTSPGEGEVPDTAIKVLHGNDAVADVGRLQREAELLRSADHPDIAQFVDVGELSTGAAFLASAWVPGQTLAGGLAQIDALGIFGREALDTAVIWDPYGDWIGLTEAEYNDRPLMWAFRMYRNYDGQGATFGDRSLFASSSNDAAVSIYAAERTADGTITLMVVNKNNVDTTVGLSGDVAGTNGTGKSDGNNRTDSNDWARWCGIVIATQAGRSAGRLGTFTDR